MLACLSPSEMMIGACAWARWTVIAWAVISGILMLAASLWLRRFRQGPFELVWKAGVDASFRRRDLRRAEETMAQQQRNPEHRHHHDSNASTGAP